jgi:hypothetical protein
MKAWIRLALVTGAVASGCGGPDLRNTRESPEALARAVLEAVAHEDRDALRRLALDEEEFREQVWPDLPASRPERNLPFGYVWTDLRSKSEGSLAGTLGAHRGREYELISMTFTGETTRYNTFLVHREAELAVRDRGGEVRAVRLFGSVIEKNGRFKVFSYVVDN